MKTRILLLVGKDHRRKGIGLKLLEKAVERAKEQGAAEAHLDTVEKEAEQLLEAERFTARIKREANEAIPCPSCASSGWRMQPKHLANLGSSCSGLDFAPS